MIRSVNYLKLVLVAALLIPALLMGQEVPDQAEEEAAIREVGTEYVEAFNKHDATALAGYWSPDAVYLNRIRFTR